MTEKLPFDLDAAFAALERDERAARPAPSGDLVARVLSDAAGVAAERRHAGAAARPQPRSASEATSRVASGGGWLRLFGFTDAWAGAAVAAVLVFLVAGFGLGYEAGPEVMAEVGFTDPETRLADAGEALFPGEEAI